MTIIYGIFSFITITNRNFKVYMQTFVNQKTIGYQNGIKKFDTLWLQWQKYLSSLIVMMVIRLPS
jgi:ABC-type phosphate transport system permease subunit